MKISRKNLLNAIYQNNKAIADIDRQLASLVERRNALEKQTTRLQDTLKALQNEDRECIEVVELDYRTLDIPGARDKAWIGVNRLVIFADKYQAMLQKESEPVAVRVEKLKFAKRRLTIRLSSERVERGIDQNGDEVIEYVERAYIDSETYDMFYLQAKGGWEHESMIREGLKLRLI